LAAGTHRGGVLLVQHARGGLLGKSREKGEKKPFGFEYILYAFTVVWLKKTKKKFFQIEFFIKKNFKKGKEKKTHRGVFLVLFL